MTARYVSSQASIFTGEGQYYIIRAVGLPGDEIYMTDYVFRVKPESRALQSDGI
ncbi:MAG: hypothetical protein LBU82_01265 [Treponema sp.]|nr:hypothetical protein [Treponema sp.]